MEATSEFVCEVQEAEFEQRVIRASSERPVIVDFWAPWCAPCRMLGPILEKIVESFGGRAILAKLNVDGAQELAVRYGIRGIPAVKVFRNGRVAAEFLGVKSERDIRQLLSPLISSDLDEIAAKAEELAGLGRNQEAEKKYLQILEKQPDHPGALLGLGRIAFAGGDADGARKFLSRLRINDAEYKAAASLLAELDFLKECSERGGKEAAQKRLAGQPEDLDAVYAHSCCLAAEKDYIKALDGFLRIIRLNKTYCDGAARVAMLRIFSIVGERSRLAEEYRSKLAQALF